MCVCVYFLHYKVIVYTVCVSLCVDFLLFLVLHNALYVHVHDCACIYLLANMHVHVHVHVYLYNGFETIIRVRTGMDVKFSVVLNYFPVPHFRRCPECQRIIPGCLFTRTNEE